MAAQPPLGPPPTCLHANTGVFCRSKRIGIGILGTLSATILFAACSSDPPREPVAPPGPSSTPVAAIEPIINAQILLHEAAEQERNGYWESAAELRRSVLDSSVVTALSNSERAEAQLAQVRLLLRLERAAEAESELVALRTWGGEATIAGLTLDLLHGRVQLALANWPEAEAAYARYVAAEGPATSTVRNWQAGVLESMDDPDAALAVYDTVIESPLASPSDIQHALLRSGVLLENQERYREAQAQYTALADASPWVDDDTFALLRGGLVAYALGDEAAAVDDWLRLIADYPWNWRAMEAFDALIARGQPVPALLKGILLYRQFRPEEAQSTLKSFIASSPSAEELGVARYYVAAVAEDAGDDETAIAEYLRALSDDPDGPLADDALWWAARLLEDSASYSSAAILYQQLADNFPQEDRAAEAAFRRVLLTYRQEAWAESEAKFLDLAESAPVRSDQQRAWLWVGITRGAAGDAATADNAYRVAQILDPASYYGLRAAARLEAYARVPAGNAGPGLGQVEALNPQETRNWLGALAGPEPSDLDEQLAQSPAWAAALDLFSTDATVTANLWVGEHLHAISDDAWLLYRTGRALEELGSPHLRAGAAERLVALVLPSERVSAPAEILRWAYSRGWAALVALEAATYEIDDLLLHALIRQESAFNPEAGSVAGALGLTQIIPPTAGEIAVALGDSNLDIADLFRPERSIRYGAYYLSRQLSAFDGAPWIALAAYNGGPGNAYAWAGSDTGIDPDLFLEQITFTESRSYVQRVLENYAWYQYLYRAAPAPTLLPVTRFSSTP